jgi:hypothetical protein
MAAFTPFAVITASVTGKTIAITSSGNGILDSTGGFAPCILVANPNGVMAFVRMTLEAVPVATLNDAPVAAGTVRLFANPNPIGKTGISVTNLSVTTASCFFCPGEGGDV